MQSNGVDIINRILCDQMMLAGISNSRDGVNI